MRNYEIMFIVRPDVEETIVKNTVKSFEKVLTDRKAKITLSKELGINSKSLSNAKQRALRKIKKELNK